MNEIKLNRAIDRSGLKNDKQTNGLVV